jgi:serine/threonine-protein kinase RsbW
MRTSVAKTAYIAHRELIPMILLELQLVNRPEEIARIIDALERFGKAHGIPRNVIHDMDVSLDEVLSNIISHACAGDAVRMIAVRLTLTDRQLVANIDDEGKPFDPLTVAPPNLNGPSKDRAIGGLGIHFVRALMDHVAYVRRDDRNCLELKKKL